MAFSAWSTRISNLKTITWFGRRFESMSCWTTEETGIIIYFIRIIAARRTWSTKTWRPILWKRLFGSSCITGISAISSTSWISRSYTSIVWFFWTSPIDRGGWNISWSCRTSIVSWSWRSTTWISSYCWFIFIVDIWSGSWCWRSRFWFGAFSKKVVVVIIVVTTISWFGSRRPTAFSTSKFI